MTDQKTVAITGASNGMGYEATKLFAKKGWKVYAGARRVEKIPQDGENIVAIKLDVTDSTSNHAFIEQIFSDAGHIDVLINNAGYGEYGPAEEIPMDKIRKQFETNFFGAVELTQLVLPIMRAQNYGRIVNISSIGGDVYMPLGAYYHATKAAIQQWSDVLDLEVAPFGIRSICIQPGGTQSSWGSIALDNSKANMSENSAYQPLVSSVATGLERFMKNSAKTTDLAELFYKAATDIKPSLRYLHSFSDKFMVYVARNHPKVFRKALLLAMRYFEKK
jgi:NAD(P)-dependent dehydrogenase (short-subunit alcohol dehydrogenase family)